MTEMTEKNDLPGQLPPEPEMEQPRPGKRLQQAREAKGFTREEVAAQLRLQVRLITALEEDNYDALPSKTFVSGYLRSYARLLELPDDSFVAHVASESEPPPLVATVASKKQATSRDWFTRLVTYLIIGAIVVSVAMWWLAQRQAVEQEFNAPEPEVVEQGGSMNLTLPEEESQVVEGEAAMSQMPVPEVNGADEQQAVESDSVPVEPSAAVPATEEASNEGEKTEPAPLTEATPQSKLELRYEADSWTEVSDNADRQLAYGLIKAGEVLVVRGEAPFRVFLGYAPGVTVYYNNDLFDHSPFQRRDVARFRIGRAEHNHPGSR